MASGSVEPLLTLPSGFRPGATVGVALTVLASNAPPTRGSMVDSTGLLTTSVYNSTVLLDNITFAI